MFNIFSLVNSFDHLYITAYILQLLDAPLIDRGRPGWWELFYNNALHLKAEENI